MRKLKRGIIMILVLTFVLSLGSMAFANSGIADDVINDLQNRDGQGVMGEGVMNTVSGLSRDIFNIVRYVVIAILVIKAFTIFSQFSNAGDNPQLKASLKSRLLWTAGGIVLALNFWGIYNFLANSINLGLA
jgi:hypothetical protein